MSGFPPTGFHCANRAIARVHHRRCRGGSRIARAHDRRSRLLRRLDAPRACTTSASAANWKFVDNDLDFCCMPPMRSGVTTAPIDLVCDLKAAAVDSSLDLVTTSALLIVCHPIPGSNGS